MARLETYYFNAHNNIYKKDDTAEPYSERRLRVEVGFPETGTDENTGILVLIPPYGGHIDSKVYQKMRRVLSDSYNLIVLQCDYFGNKYMQNMDDFKKVFEEYNVTQISAIIKNGTKESEEEFNDMGILQALDIVSTTLDSIYEFQRKGICFDTRKILYFGSSHGAYLAHLANLICPHLCACILDVSAYMKPYYLESLRNYVQSAGASKVIWEITQFLNSHPEYRYKEELYDLRFLYPSIHNQCRIIAFQGTEDWMVDAKEKSEFIEALPNAELMLFGKEDIDGVFCKNADHGLGMDFFKLFELILPLLEKVFLQRTREIILPELLRLGNEEAYFEICYIDGKPILSKNSKWR